MRLMALLLFCLYISPLNAKSLLCRLILGKQIEDHIDVTSCQYGRCFRNAGIILDQLRKQKNFDINNARVLFISSFDSWGVHVVVEYEGKIMDIEYPNGVSDKSNRVVSVPIEKYFKIHKWNVEASRVLEAPAVNWTEKVSAQDMWDHDRIVSGWKEFIPSEYPGYRMLNTVDYLQNPRRNPR